MSRGGDGTLGIDVGGTTIKGIRVGPSGTVEAEHRVPTPTGDPSGDRVVEAVAAVVAALGGSTAAPIGLVVPGIVDEIEGVAVWSANVGFDRAPLRASAERRLGTRVAFGHDVRAAALAEMRSGAARDRPGSLAFVPVGTGVAAAFAVDGRILVSDGWAGEIGQTVITSGPHAGLRVEQVASASATARRAGEEGTLAVARRVAAGDAAATAVWSDTVAVLADALAGIVATVAPRTIIVGGGLAGAGALLFDPLTVELARRIGSSRAPDLIPPHHGDLAAAIGATHLAADLAELIASGSPA